MANKEYLIVLFRQFDDNKIIALFPYENCKSIGVCDSRLLNKENEIAELELLYDTTRAKVNRYQDLLKEVEILYPDRKIVIEKRVNFNKHAKAYRNQSK